MKLKPYSLQFRFLLMQAVSILVALWLVAGALYLSQFNQDKLSASLQQLQAELSVHSQTLSTLDQMVRAFWQAYNRAPGFDRAEFDSAAGNLNELNAAHQRLVKSAQDRAQLQSLARLEFQLVELTTEILDRRPGQAPGDALAEVRRLNTAIRSGLREIAARQSQRLQDSTSQLHRDTAGMVALLLACAAFALVAIGSFRHVHRHQLWGPIEELRRMVFEVRRGNLKIQGKIPRSAELGPLMRAFLDMAAELRGTRDSLEQKVVERTAALQAAQSQLLRAAKLSALGQLISGVAHEINNPLTSILGFSEVLLERKSLGPGVLAQVQTIRDEALRLKNLVASLSRFARQGPQHMRPLDLRQVLARLVELRAYQLAASDIQLHYQPPGSPVPVRGDLEQLLQVLFNLVLNSEQAIKACRERGEIRLSCGLQDGRAWLEVVDNGAGMPPEIVQHIFDPFFTTRPAGRGSGLGLSISHGIVLQHRGGINAESVEGKGTKIHVWLPAELEATLTSRPAPASVPARPNGPRVLVVDDEPGITSLISAALEQRGCRVTVLNNPLEVDSALERAEFDSILCDLKMPMRNGLEILRLVRQRQPRLAARFLLMTGNTAELEKYSEEFAGRPILPKPFTLAQLDESLESLMSAAER